LTFCCLSKYVYDSTIFYKDINTINENIIKQQSIIINNLKDNKTITNHTTSTNVYLIDKNRIEKMLPFCPLVDNDSIEFCYDYAYFDGYEGISIINLNNKVEEYDQ
jgi:hypothetical protein